TGVAALLLSWQRKRGQKPDPGAVREALLRSAIGCLAQPVADCRRLLAGRLNVKGAVNFLTRGERAMSEPVHGASAASGPNPPQLESVSPAAVSLAGPPPSADPMVPSMVPAAGCGCSGSTSPSLVYALGQLGYDFAS